MSIRMTNVGFGRLAKPTGKPVSVPTPKVYDFTDGKRPHIPAEERADAGSAPRRDSGSPVPTPELIDIRQRRG